MIAPIFNVIMETVYYALLNQAKETLEDLAKRERQKQNEKPRRDQNEPKQYEW